MAVDVPGQQAHSHDIAMHRPVDVPLAGHDHQPLQGSPGAAGGGYVNRRLPRTPAIHVDLALHPPKSFLQVYSIACQSAFWILSHSGTEFQDVGPPLLTYCQNEMLLTYISVA